MRRSHLSALLTASAVACAAFAGCGGDSGKPAQSAQQGTAQSTYAGGTDRAKCEYKNRPDREVTESRGPGALVPNIRRVYAIIGELEDSRRVIICREVDSNLDGAKDVVRTYDEKGEALREEADANYDGKMDTWITFARGRIAKYEVDSNRDGQPDETRYYLRGELTRIQRDTNFDGKPDTFEIYRDGVLERMGVDLDFDGQVDRWDRDEVAMRAAAEKERQDEEREEKAKAAAASDAGATDAYVSPRKR